MKTLFKLLAFALFVIILITGAIFALRPAFADNLFHPEEAGIRTVTADANQMIVDHASTVQERMKNDQRHKAAGSGFLAGWRESRAPLASEVAEARNSREQILARAYGRIPLKRQPVVLGWQNQWQTFFPVHEDLLLTVGENDSICSGHKPSQCYHAEGPFKNWTPSELEDKKTVEQDPDQGGDQSAGPGTYRALIARICNGYTCTGIVEPGFQAAFCGSHVSGNAQLWTNGATRFGVLPVLQDFFYGTGGISFEVEPSPVAVAACAANPGKAIIRLQ
jgi:hypothetical protein